MFEILSLYLAWSLSLSEFCHAVVIIVIIVNNTHSQLLSYRSLALAYSLNDIFRPLRTVMRVDALLVGFGVGALLLVTPKALLAASGLYDGDSPVWFGRLAGALLVTLGLHLWMAAQERIVSTPSMITMALANGLMAVVLLTAYLQQELAALSLLGRIVLVLVFLVCLVSAISPLRYLRAEIVG